MLSDLGQRVGVHDNRGTLIIPELSQADLAEMIASSRPLVSRLLNEMEERGLVQRRGKQYLLLKGWDSQEHKLARTQSPLGDEPSSAEPAAAELWPVLGGRRSADGARRGGATLKGVAEK